MYAVVGKFKFHTHLSIIFQHQWPRFPQHALPPPLRDGATLLTTPAALAETRLRMRFSPKQVYSGSISFQAHVVKATYASVNILASVSNHSALPIAISSLHFLSIMGAPVISFHNFDPQCLHTNSQSLWLGVFGSFETRCDPVLHIIPQLSYCRRHLNHWCYGMLVW